MPKRTATKQGTTELIWPKEQSAGGAGKLLDFAESIVAGAAADPDVSIDSLISVIEPEAPIDWRNKFRRLEQLNDGDPIMVIDQVLIEGTTMIGALSAAGKTWVALSMAKAITSGKPFLGRFAVREPRNVLYLIPESGDRAFRRRAEWMGINGERFLCRTQNDSTTLALDDAALLEACKEWKPAIFLDTAIRFSMAKDENSASENAIGLGTAIGELLKAGAVAVVGLHHSAKGTREHEELFLETALRGSGDIGAMADCVWSIQWDNGGPNLKAGTPAKKEFEDESRRLFRLWFKCVKPRDIEPEPKPIRLQGRSAEGVSYLSTEGDFRVLDLADLPDSPGTRLCKLVEADQTRSISSLAKDACVTEKKVKEYLSPWWELVASGAGKSGKWQRRSILPGGVSGDLDNPY